MSQMLVRIDKKMNDALIEIAKAITIGDEAILFPKEAVLTILEGVMSQWTKNRSNEETAEIIGFKRAKESKDSQVRFWNVKEEE